MKNSRRMQLGAMLAAVLLVAVVFVGVATPNKEYKNFPKDLPERVLLGLNDSELQDREIPDFGPEVFEKIKKEPKVLKTRGKIPKFETETERKDWLNNLDNIRVDVRDDMRPYLYPNGTVIMYGWDDEGYFDVLFYENLTMDTYTDDKIYAIIDNYAKKRGNQEIPVVFRIGDFPKLLAGYDTKWRPIVGGIRVDNGTRYGTLGFAVKDTNGNNGYVTAEHLAPQVGMQLWQPLPGSGNEAGTVTKLGTNTADAEFIRFSNVEASIHIGGGYYVPVKGDLEPRVDWKVYKSGITTAITMGYVKGIYETISYNGRTYYNQVKSTLSCNGGDSGSPVWYLDANTNRQIVGILTSKMNIGGTDYCYFSNIRWVKSSLGVTVLTR